MDTNFRIRSVSHVKLLFNVVEKKTKYDVDREHLTYNSKDSHD